MQMINTYKPRELIGQTLNGGVDVVVRGLKTRENLNRTVWLDGHNLVMREGMDPLLGVLLSQYILSGKGDTEVLVKYAKELDATIPWEDYDDASRVGSQLEYIILELLYNSTSRRAVMYLGNSYDSIDKRPCIESIQFLRRYGFLYVLINMRSWDLVKEMPLDILTWGLVGQAVSYCLDNEPVRLRFNVASAHVYHNDFEIAKRMEYGTMDTLNIMRMRTLSDYRQLADSTIGMLIVDKNWEDAMNQVLENPYVKE